MNMNTQTSRLKTSLVAAAVASVLAGCASSPAKPADALGARTRLTQLQSDPALANRAPLAVQAADTAVRLAEQPESDSALVAYRVYMADRKVDLARAQAETRLAEDQRPALIAEREKVRLDARTSELEVARGETASALAEGAEQKSAADAARNDANSANRAAADSNEQALEARSETGSADLRAADSNRQALDARSEADSANLAAATSNQQAVDARSEADRSNLAATTSNQQAVDARSEADRSNLAAATSNQQAVDARSDASSADLAAADSRKQASEARREADNANLAVTAAKQETAELQQRIDSLQARVTDRGLVVTLGDVLFTSGEAGLKKTSSGNLERLVTFLDQYPDRTATIEGYTDNRGSDESNQVLSQRRADAVKSYLVERGVSSDRLVASGGGEGSPVAGNDSAAGRQQNRRVEVIITNPPPAAVLAQ